MAPATPVAPLVPAEPVAPLAPAEPVAPVKPVSPLSPVRWNVTMISSEFVKVELPETYEHATENQPVLSVNDVIVYNANAFSSVFLDILK